MVRSSRNLRCWRAPPRRPTERPDCGRGRLSYFREFRVHWPTLFGACLGLALGSALNQYMLNLFGPALIAEFGWTKSQFALVGTLSLVTLVVVPFAGRFVDRVGARVSALIGFTVVPLAFASYSFMSGEIWQFYAITLVKNMFGILTTSLVFCRVVVERFDAARGIALSVVMSGAPVVGGLAVPLVGEIVDAEGWRTGYRGLAAMSVSGGIGAVLLMGRKRPAPDSGQNGRKAEDVAEAGEERPLAQFLVLARQPVFLLMVAGMFLVNLPMVIVNSQLKLVLAESGASSDYANWLISLYAASVVVGRFACGLALDRVPAHVVAVIALGLPAFGFAGLASGSDARLVLAACIALVGLAQGAEGDIGAFLASRKFPIAHYSFVYSFIIASMVLASATGSVTLSMMLRGSDSYAPFLWIAAALTVVGAAAFYLTGRARPAPPPNPIPHTA